MQTKCTEDQRAAYFCIHCHKGAKGSNGNRHCLQCLPINFGILFIFGKKLSVLWIKTDFKPILWLKIRDLFKGKNLPMTFLMALSLSMPIFKNQLGEFWKNLKVGYNLKSHFGRYYPTRHCMTFLHQWSPRTISRH